jgi:hypothetical protein
MHVLQPVDQLPTAAELLASCLLTSLASLYLLFLDTASVGPGLHQASIKRLQIFDDREAFLMLSRELLGIIKSRVGGAQGQATERGAQSMMYTVSTEDHRTTCASGKHAA